MYHILQCVRDKTTTNSKKIKIKLTWLPVAHLHSLWTTFKPGRLINLNTPAIVLIL